MIWGESTRSSQINPVSTRYQPGTRSTLPQGFPRGPRGIPGGWHQPRGPQGYPRGPPEDPREAPRGAGTNPAPTRHRGGKNVDISFILIGKVDPGSRRRHRPARIFGTTRDSLKPTRTLSCEQLLGNYIIIKIMFMFIIFELLLLFITFIVKISCPFYLLHV